MAARSFPPRDGRDPRRPAEPPARLLPRAAATAPAAMGGAHANLRDGSRAAPAQRQPAGSIAARPIHQQLPVGRAADHRRALGVAEHPEAGAHREPPPARRRNDRGARVADCRGRHGQRMRSRTPRVGAIHISPIWRMWSACCSGRESTARASPPLARDHRTAPGRAGDDGGGCHSQRTPAPGCGVGVGGQRPDQPAALFDARLERLLRGGQPRGAGAAARPVRRVRLDGLPEPRPSAPGGRGTGGADRRGAGARGASRD